MEKLKPARRKTAKPRQKRAERTEQLVAALRRWQKIEREAIETSAELMEQTDNLLVRQVLEIIRNDSVQHHRVQQFIIDSLTKAPVQLKPEELALIWDQVQQHDEVEREVVELGKSLRDSCPSFVQRTLLDYLIYDEEKHDMLLGELEKFKKNLYPYA